MSPQFAAILVTLMTTAKKWILFMPLAVLGCIVVFSGPPRDRTTARVASSSGDPSFEVWVEKPLLARPLFGLVPPWLEARLSGEGDLMFGQTSPGAEIVEAGSGRLALRADGWGFAIATVDGPDETRPITGETSLVFPIRLAGHQRRLRCRPDQPPRGHLRATLSERTSTVDGDFLVKLGICENDETGRTIAWPTAPLRVHGRFRNLPDTSATSRGSGAPGRDE